DAGKRIEWLLGYLDHERGRALMGAGSLEAVLELQPRQVAREQQIALDGADVGRPIGDDLGGVVRKEVAILRQRCRPLHPVDIALDDLNRDRGAVRRELLRWNDRARQHIAVAAVP